MFYSHQLLCKKGPLGQIWIAATMHAKINRKKTEQIDIEEICMQILQPQVPLALRLSGILMGGVVLVFHRKVKFLHDDVTEFLLKIKTALSTKANDHVISLPKGKSHAKYENVTINYDFDADFDDIERPMMRPSTPGRRDSSQTTPSGNCREYVIISKPRDPPRQQFVVDVGLDNLYCGPDLLQADRADITLEDHITSSNDQFRDFGMDIQDERLPTTDHDPDQMDIDMDRLFPEMQFSGNGIGSNSQEQQEQQPASEQDPTEGLQKSPSQVEEPIGPDSPEHGEAAAPAAPAQKKRRRQVPGKSKCVFDEYTGIPATVFESWLRKPEDIVGRGKVMKKDSGTLRVQKLFQLPSASLSRRSFIPELVPDWTSQLTNLWNLNFGAMHIPQENNHLAGVHKNSPDASTSLPNTSVPNNGAPSPSHSGPSHWQPGGEFNSLTSSSSDTTKNVEPAVGQPQDVPNVDSSKSRMQATLTSVERLRSHGQPDLKEYGSVEKLRTALQSPSTGSEDHIWGNQVRLTPNLSEPSSGEPVELKESPGQFGTSAGGRPNSRLSTPGSGKLPFDIEVEPFTAGSGRFKKARLSPPAMGSGEFPADDYYAEHDIPAPDDMSDYFASLRGSLRGSLSQFELLEETGPSTQGAGPQDAMNNVSVTVLQVLHENFNDLGAQCKEHQSLEGLSKGMDKSQAAKLFYQILVLTSSNYLAVSQDVPFGDIQIGRGLHM